jgi:hypothetical protein
MKRLLPALALLSGCATLFADDVTRIQISASPGAPVSVDGAPAGHSPTVVEVSTHVDHVVVVGDRSCRLFASVGGVWVVLDIVAGVWPLVVDLVTEDWKTVQSDGCQI